MIMPVNDKPQKPIKPPRRVRCCVRSSGICGRRAASRKTLPSRRSSWYMTRGKRKRMRRKRELIEEALEELDPTNVDALLTVAQHSGLEGAEEIELLRLIVSTGEKNLGPEMFTKHTGDFWDIIATRSYMRAREELAEALRWSGRVDRRLRSGKRCSCQSKRQSRGAIQCWSVNLMLGRLEAARRLFGLYQDDCPTQHGFRVGTGVGAVFGGRLGRGRWP